MWRHEHWGNPLTYRTWRHEHRGPSCTHLLGLIHTDDYLLRLRCDSKGAWNRKEKWINEPWMHSSRMRTVRCSSRLLGEGVSVGGCLPRGKGVMSVQGCIPACTEADTPMDRIFDTRLWKHYLAATSLRPVITHSWVSVHSKEIFKGTKDLFVVAERIRGVNEPFVLPAPEPSC